MKPKTFLTVAGALALGAAWSTSGAAAAPTYTKDVAPIMNANCVVCHRPGEIAPMSLTTYEEVRPWIKAIAQNVSERVMPPWHADQGFGPWANDRSLSDEEIAIITEWAKAGAPRGDVKDMPPMPDFPEGDWKLGEPYLVVTFE